MLLPKWEAEADIYVSNHPLLFYTTMMTSRNTWGFSPSPSPSLSPTISPSFSFPLLSSSLLSYLSLSLSLSSVPPLCPSPSFFPTYVFLCAQSITHTWSLSLLYLIDNLPRGGECNELVDPYIENYPFQGWCVS